MMSGTQVVAVVLNWNKAQETAKCVHALRLQSHDALTVIAVDNGSVEGSLAQLEALTPPLLILHNEFNLGFAGGVNVGIKQAMTDGADYIWLVNNDAIPEQDALARCIAAMTSDSTIGLVSPVILNAEAGDSIEFCGGLWDEQTFQTTDKPATYRVWQADCPGQLWLVGTALLIRRSLVDAIGLFDEKLFAYWEDNDYSVRALGSGFRCAVALDATVRHWSGRPKTHPGLKPIHYHYYMARNELLFIRKHIRLVEQPKLLLWAIHRQFRLLNRLDGYPAAVHAILLGLLDGALGRGGVFQPERQLSTAASSFLQVVARRWAG